MASFQEEQRRPWCFLTVLLLTVCVFSALLTTLAALAATLAPQGKQSRESSQGLQFITSPGGGSSTETLPETACMGFGQLNEPLSSSTSAQLVLKLNENGTIRNRTLEWYDKSVDRAFLGSGFNYTGTKLMVLSAGFYKIYAHMTVKRQDVNSEEEVNTSLIVHHCKANSLISSPVLTLPLHLSSTSNKKVTAFMATSSYWLAEQDTLFVYLTAGTHSGFTWSLDSQCNIFGVSKISAGSN